MVAKHKRRNHRGKPAKEKMQKTQTEVKIIKIIIKCIFQWNQITRGNQHSRLLKLHEPISTTNTV